MLRRIAKGLVLALLLTLPATAQDHQKGVAAYKRGDYATALKEWRPLAEQGHANAQDNLGLM
ncbi:MAG: sel1 repeat family protein, partial [Alphaproteobacteria bacterium]|nr:sel1 repeat family protein [Alphaproteobacteria bacterium]